MAQINRASLLTFDWVPTYYMQLKLPTRGSTVHQIMSAMIQTCNPEARGTIHKGKCIDAPGSSFPICRPDTPLHTKPEDGGVSKESNKSIERSL
jgi:hypothetical protein